MFSRSSGILLHISSLPGKYGIGSLGKEAFQFADFLSNTKQSLWQILPLCPMGPENCPYVGISAFAGNHFFIDIDALIEEGLLTNEDVMNLSFPDDFVDYTLVNKGKSELLKRSYSNFITRKKISDREFESFCTENSSWLDDYSLFMALMSRNKNLPWHQWEKPLKFRDKNALIKATDYLKNEIAFHKYLQYVFFKQWYAVKKYVNEKGIKIIGDNPIYVSYDSCDVWTNPGLFQLDDELSPVKVSGVPPDYFCVEGQLWGHPLYNWEKHESSDFEWWVNNMKATFKIIDILRIDHFIGFVNYWAIPYQNQTAKNGIWEKAPGYNLFDRLKNELQEIPIIAEDLGNKTSEVGKLMEKMKFPGMKLLQEGIMGGINHPFAPHNFESADFVVYTSTHDSDTVKGWFYNLKSSDQQKVLIGLGCKENEIVKEMITLAWSSVAVITIAQMQDILELGSTARMNIPGKGSGNWRWRMNKNYIKEMDGHWLSEITKKFNR